MELLPGEQLGRYVVVGRLAAGGMAEVYAVKSLGHRGFQKPLALKRMLPDHAAKPGFREMFLREAEIASRLSHPNIVQVVDFAEERGELFLVMELVHGHSLIRMRHDAMRLAKERNDPSLLLHPLLAASVAKDIARALGYAWTAPGENGEPLHLVHRDISPQNILVDFQGQVLLADFGIARSADINTSAGVLKGKLQYMAPEQLACKALDARTDIYALGIVLYEAAANLEQPLFDGHQTTRMRVKGAPLTPPHDVCAEVPESLSAIIMKALEHDPESRFQSADEFAETLVECIHEEAHGTADYDLLGYLRRLYGEPPPIKGLVSDGPAQIPTRPERRISTPVQAAESRAPEAAERLPSVQKPAELEVIAVTIPSKHSGRFRAYGPALMGVFVALVAIAASLGIWGRGRLPGMREPLAAPAKLNEQPPEPPSRSATTAGAPSTRGTGLSDVVSVAWNAPESPSTQMAAPIVAPPSPEGTQLTPPTIANERTSTPEQPKKRAPGTLVLFVKPWGYAWLDGETYTGSQDQETTSPIQRKVAAGKHVVHLRDNQGRQKDVQVMLAPGGQTYVEGPVDQIAVH